MSLFELKPSPGSTKKSTRIGRGTGNGTGQTCGKGNKGQKCRSGGKLSPWFEGGQMPLYRRIPKRGFKSINKVFFNIVNISSLSNYKDGDTIDEKTLLAKGLIKDNGAPIKILANGKFNVKELKIFAHAISKSADRILKKASCVVSLIK